MYITTYVVTVQGRFVNVYRSRKQAEAVKLDLEMGGNMGVSILEREI